MPAGAHTPSSSAAAAAADVTSDMLIKLSAADRGRASATVAAPGKENQSQNSSQGTTQTTRHLGSTAKRTRHSEHLETRSRQDQPENGSGTGKDDSKPLVAAQAAKSTRVNGPHGHGPHSGADAPATAEQVADRSTPQYSTAPAQRSPSTPPGAKQQKGVLVKASAHPSHGSHHIREFAPVHDPTKPVSDSAHYMKAIRDHLTGKRHRIGAADCLWAVILCRLQPVSSVMCEGFEGPAFVTVCLRSGVVGKGPESKQTPSALR